MTVVSLCHSSSTTLFGKSISFAPNVRRAIPAASSVSICLFVGSQHSSFIITAGGIIPSNTSQEKASTLPSHGELLDYNLGTFSPTHSTCMW